MGHTFREIDEELLKLVDDEGEILDIEAFEALQIEKEKKAEGMALWALDLRDEQEALKNEIDRLEKRLASAKRKEDSLKRFLAVVLDGQKMKTPTVSVSYRSTPSVEISNEDKVIGFAEKHPGYENILRYKPPEISKTEVKKLLQEGVEIPGARMTSSTSTIIK